MNIETTDRPVIPKYKVFRPERHQTYLRRRDWWRHFGRPVGYVQRNEPSIDWNGSKYIDFYLDDKGQWQHYPYSARALPLALAQAIVDELMIAKPNSFVLT